MTLKTDVIELAARHPDWSSTKIAEFLGAAPSSVRSVGHKSRLTFAPKNALTVKRQHKRVPYAGKEAGQPEWLR